MTEPTPPADLTSGEPAEGAASGYGNPLPPPVPSALALGEVAVIPLTAAAGLVLLLLGAASSQSTLEYVGAVLVALSVVAVVVVVARAMRRRRTIPPRQ